ncbi:hypothetical protein ASH00_15795 [Arthrobacter sp. Soil782]|uniref:hypothetical protein n=1 Tax=Arthrobacter sp. Soil782 TaxID=1736410 RepID=UPI0006FB1ABA|nr:hypothetical protein [Arthrobacter sp. Soil782]KRF03247.1 hypothetical protein ASH00_15795 [Arthrobacter sp. Soil782]
MKKWLLVLALLTSAALVAGLAVWAPWSSPQETAIGTATKDLATGEGWSAAASFPDNPDLTAHVEPAGPDNEQTAVFPVDTTLRALADYSVEGADFPAGGAEISFTLDEPLAEDRGAAIAHWNETSKRWDPVEAVLSEDRRTVTAEVTHFSQYGFFDYLFNAIGQVTGNAASSGVTCDQPIPSWADPQYFDDINSPVLWCGGKDANNADLLVAKLKMNRDTAAKVTIAIDPDWAWSDLWQGSPTDLATMAASAELSSNPFGKREYLIQPFGELHFGFSRSALEDLYYGGDNPPLIQVETGWFYSAAGLMWSQLGGMADGDSPIAAISSTMAMLDCGQALLTANSSSNAVEGFRGTLACLGTQQSKDLVHRGVRTVLADRYPHLTDGWITVHSRKILSKFAILGAGVQTVSLSTKAFSAIGDATLPDSVRQFQFSPSLDAIRARAPQKKTYDGTQMGTNYSFSYPKDWSVVELSENEFLPGLTVSDSSGNKVATLSIFSVWGATAVQGQFRPVALTTHQPGTGSMSAGRPGGSGASSFHVRTVTMDLTDYPADVATYGWPQPVAVAVSADMRTTEETATELPPYLLAGIGVINAIANPNGQPSAVVQFGTTRHFATLQEAEAWTSTDEYQRVVDMIASFDG